MNDGTLKAFGDKKAALDAMKIYEVNVAEYKCGVCGSRSNIIVGYPHGTACGNCRYDIGLPVAKAAAKPEKEPEEETDLEAFFEE